MSKPTTNRTKLTHLPLLVRIGEAEDIFGISRHRLMQMVREDKVRTIRLSPRGRHRFPVYELACALGMSEMVPRVALPIGRDLIRDIDAEVIRAVQETQAAFRHELRTGLETLKRDMQNMVKDTSTPRRPAQAPVQRTLKSNQPIVQPGGSY